MPRKSVSMLDFYVNHVYLFASYHLVKCNSFSWCEFIVEYALVSIIKQRHRITSIVYLDLWICTLRVCILYDFCCFGLLFRAVCACWFYNVFTPIIRIDLLYLGVRNSHPSESEYIRSECIYDKYSSAFGMILCVCLCTVPFDRLPKFTLKNGPELTQC